MASFRDFRARKLTCKPDSTQEAGSWGADYYAPIGPAEGELEIVKHRHSGFVATTLDLRAKGMTLMRGRPITAEEFERMLASVESVRPDDAQAWSYYLRGLWLSGLPTKVAFCPLR